MSHHAPGCGAFRYSIAVCTCGANSKPTPTLVSLEDVLRVIDEFADDAETASELAGYRGLAERLRDHFASPPPETP